MSMASASMSSAVGKKIGGQNCFLGLEWAVEGVRAVVVDEHLDIVVTEEVRFENELPEYGTRGGVLVSHNTYALNVPVEMYIKALDLLLTKLTQLSLPQRIRSISGSAPSLLLPTTSFPPSVTLPAPSQPLHNALNSLLSFPHTPLPHPLTSPAHIPALLASLLPSLPSQTSALTTLPSLLVSLFCGSYTLPSASELAATGGKLWDKEKCEWDEQGLRELLRLGLGGSDDLGDAPARVKEMMPRCSLPGLREAEEVGRIAPYFVTRYGFSPDTTVHAFQPPHIAFYLSQAPSSTTGVMALGTPDVLLVPLTSIPPPQPVARSAMPSSINRVWEREDASVVPHPAGLGEGYIGVVVSSYGEEARQQAMGKYTKTWTAFDRLVAVVPPGGSIGLDNKLFCFWGPQGQFRFRFGKTAEFEDSRVIPRCLLESQMLHLRVRLSRLLAPISQSPKPLFPSSVPFDVYDPIPLPRRMIINGTTANYPAMAQLISDIFHSIIFVSSPTTAPGQPAFPFPDDMPKPELSRSALGSAYLARYAWRRLMRLEETARYATYGDEVRALLKRKAESILFREREREWERARDKEREGLVAKGVLKKPGSSFYSHPGSRLSTTMLATVDTVEEVDETEEDDLSTEPSPPMTSYQQPPSAFGRSSSLLMTPKTSPELAEPITRTRTLTGGSNTSIGSYASLASTPSAISHTSSPASLASLTTPGLMPPFGESPSASGSPAAMPEVVGLQTDEADVLLGLRKLADSDIDAFMGYAAIVPEFLRLERMLAMGTVI
ncbi:hypothetical protein DACRYDRAFT_24727 [Dacryopinax primogenitus]|uniref:Actin-like ATPase domain-containing protein n=1 Tax=Dacryopinax primogenitus (strain DJM 731) TaxID=1858805 RepID=M5FP70_DACPD|nr:uncharacterized protein DACRYDRAFT_24727 [Dacryopinax primogenitus]EJT98275.1 hypothetical protein DACRYDRAFT_24727 [Dacryopinax primogenitus]